MIFINKRFENFTFQEFYSCKLEKKDLALAKHSKISHNNLKEKQKKKKTNAREKDQLFGLLFFGSDKL